MKDKIDVLITSELKRANGIHRSFFVSAHEGKSVIEEEVEESIEAVGAVARWLDHLWIAVKGDDEKSQKHSVEQIRKHAKYAAEELIQVCAMCDKFTKSFEEDEK